MLRKRCLKEFLSICSGITHGDWIGLPDFIDTVLLLVVRNAGHTRARIALRFSFTYITTKVLLEGNTW